MPHQTTLTYTEPLLRQAVRGFWWRSVGLGYLVAMVLLAVVMLVLWLQGDRSWFIGVMGSVLLLGILVMAALYVSHYRNTLGKFRAMGPATATMQMDEASFTVASSLGSATLAWTAVVELWQFPDVWLLMYSKAQFSTLPLANLSPDMQSFILQHLQAAGAKVIR